MNKPRISKQFELWEFGDKKNQFIGTFPTKEEAEKHAAGEYITDYFISEKELYISHK